MGMKIFFLILAHIFICESITIDDDVFLTLVTSITNLQQEVIELRNLPNKIAQLQLNRCKYQNVDDLNKKMKEFEIEQKKMPKYIMKPLEKLKKELQKVTSDKYQLDADWRHLYGLFISRMNRETEDIKKYAPTTPAPTTTTEAPIPLVCIQGKGYKLFKEWDTDRYDSVTNYRAAVWCRQQGYGHLPYTNMKTIEERKSVIEKLGLDSTLFWIGLTKEGGTWKWRDETANMTTVGFADGEPSGFGMGDTEIPESCVINWPSNDDTNSLTHLNDVKCNYAISLELIVKYITDNYEWPDYNIAILCEYDDCTAG